MKHLFVPYELALIAKNKGFNKECLGCYTHNNESGDLFIYFDGNKRRQEEFLSQKGCVHVGYQCLAPLYQQLIDWFREKHNIHIRIDQVSKEDEYSPFIFLERSSMDWTSVWKGSYYQALDKALEEAFKLI